MKYIKLHLAYTFSLPNVLILLFLLLINIISSSITIYNISFVKYMSNPIILKEELLSNNVFVFKLSHLCIIPIITGYTFLKREDNYRLILVDERKYIFKFFITKIIVIFLLLLFIVIFGNSINLIYYFFVLKDNALINDFIKLLHKELFLLIVYSLYSCIFVRLINTGFSIIIGSGLFIISEINCEYQSLLSKIINVILPTYDVNYPLFYSLLLIIFLLSISFFTYCNKTKE